MRRFFAAAATVLTLILILPVFAVTAFADNDYAGWSGDISLSMVNDDAGVFDKHPDVYDALNQELRDTAARLQMNIYVLLAGPTYRMSDSETVTFCNMAYDKQFGADTDGVIFFIDMTGKKPAYDHILTEGNAIMFYDGKTDAIREATYEYLPSSEEGNYAEHYSDIKRGVECFLRGLETYQSEFRSGLKYYYNSHTDRYVYYFNGKLVISKHKPPVVYLRSFLIAFFGGSLTNIIAFFIGKKNYKFKSKTNPNIYLSKEESRFSTKDDVFLRSHTSKTHIPQSSGSSGGSGGSHRSGGGGGGYHGGTFGGSGGHR